MNLILKHGGTSFCLKMTRTTKETALHYVANNGNAELLSNLFQALDPGQIQLGINSQSAIGWSPLCAASARGHFKCVEIMLKVSTPKSRYSVSRNSEFRDIVNKSQLPSYFTKYIYLI